METFRYSTYDGETGAYSQLKNNTKRWWVFRTRLEAVLACSLIFVSVVAFTTYSLKGKAGCSFTPCETNNKFSHNSFKVALNVDDANFISKVLMNSIDKESIRSHLKNITKNYHPAGTPENMHVMDYIARAWKSYGMDKVETEEYEVLLSYPVYSEPNTLLVLNDDSETWAKISNGTSVPLGPEEALEQQHDERAKVLWNAFSKNGTVSGSLIYAGFCTPNDFKTVADVRGTDDLTGHLILCRYGYTWRGGKVYEAGKRNASGVLLYLDPGDYGPPKDFGPDYVFPNSIYMPSVGSQRGTLSQADGDLQTPLFPSKDYAFRYYNETELRTSLTIPNMPVMPVGYGCVKEIFARMKDGLEAPKNFTGGLNVTYYLNGSSIFQMNVHATTERKKIRNVFGYIYGSEEIDRLVLLSNHVDAWTYGAFDPNSGTAIALALSKAFMSTINSTKWRPRRTLVFCAWDAEEYGLVGSNEWVEQKLHMLTNRAVSLVNIDTPLQGNVSLDVYSVPLLYRAILNAARKVPNPSPQQRSLLRETVYDTWIVYRNKTLLAGQLDVPRINFPGGGSDFKTFIGYAGVPVCDIRYDNGKGKPGYPLYHTMYEIHWTVEQLVDQHFEISLAVARLFGEIVRDLADSLVIPFNVTDYAVVLQQNVVKLFEDLNKVKNITNMVDNFNDIQFNLTEAVNRFYEKALNFQKLVHIANSGSLVSIGQVERINHRLMMIERAFITPGGLPGQPASRHVIFSTSKDNSYKAELFAGIRNSLKEFQQNSSDKQLRKTLNLQFTVVRYSIETAIDVLQM